MKYKVGDWVIMMDKRKTYKHLYGKIAKIIYIDNLLGKSQPYTIEFREKIIGGHDGWFNDNFIRGKQQQCLWVNKSDIKPLNQLKLKKLIEHGV